MTDVQTFYTLASLGVIAHILGKVWQRDGTIGEWVKQKENVRYLIATVIAVAVTALIGPGDGVDMGTVMAKLGAFSMAVTGCEFVRVIILGPTKTAARKL